MGGPFSLCGVEVEAMKTGGSGQAESPDTRLQVYATLLVTALFVTTLYKRT